MGTCWKNIGAAYGECELITFDQVDAALAYMRDNATRFAQARANRIYMEEYRKTIKSEEFLAAEGTVAEREARAYASDRYKGHLEALKEAVEIENKYLWYMRAAEAKIEAWRSQEATRRAEGKGYGT